MSPWKICDPVPDAANGNNSGLHDRNGRVISSHLHGWPFSCAETAVTEASDNCRPEAVIVQPVSFQRSRNRAVPSDFIAFSLRKRRFREIAAHMLADIQRKWRAPAITVD